MILSEVKLLLNLTKWNIFIAKSKLYLSVMLSNPDDFLCLTINDDFRQTDLGVSDKHL